METCYRHPSRETGVSCSSCGRPICPDCMTTTPVGMRCPECSRQKTQVRTVHTPRGGIEVTRILIGLNVLAFVAQIVSSSANGGGLFDPTSGTVYVRGVLFGPAIDLQNEYWRLITSGFLHANLLHIALNMYLLWILGQMLEPAIGSVRFIAIYFVSLLAGSFGALLVDPRTPTLGASGAVFGLMGAAFIELRHRGVDPMQAGIGGLILFNLVFSFLFPGISYGAHVGGLIGGGLAAMALHAGDRVRSRALGLAGCAVLAAAAVAAGIAAAASSTGLG
jgi:membrane associated rhomboid family serine protease